MRVVQRILFVVLLTGLMAAQSSPPSGSSSKLETDVQKLLDAVAAQQKAIAEQQQQISDQKQEIDRLKQQLNTQTAAAPAEQTQSGRMVNATLTTPSVSAAPRAVSDVAETQETPKESPLSFRIGGAEFTPGGFVDFENVFRSTNTGNVAATNFWAIPFSNAVAGHLSEYRATGQYSRFNIKVTEKFGANNMTGYVEFDFNGNDQPNVFTSSNGHTSRLRLYWLDLKRGKWEILGGQTWGLFTPNRVGLSPNPADVFTTIGEDAQVHVGVGYTRAAEGRVVFHANDKFQLGFAVENPQQYVGPGTVTFPSVFNAQLGSQFDNGSGSFTAGTGPGNPNVGPDVVVKGAYDTDLGSRHFHFEAGALETAAKITVLPNITGSTFVSHTSVGGGFMGGFSADLVKSGAKLFRVVAYGQYGDGIGRYLIGMAPQAVVFPTGAGCTSTTGCDARVSLVHSGDAIGGFEFAPAAKTLFGVYYGGQYAQRNFTTDISSAAATKPFIGYGGPNSSNNNNRAVQEGTVDLNQTFWRNPQYGALMMVMQASYVTRAPWFVAAGAPKNAHLMMGYVSLRYVLP